MSHLTFSYSIEEEGKVIKSGIIPTPKIQAREKKETEFVLPKFNIKPNKNYYITFSFSLKEDTVWASLGNVIAWEQFPVSISKPPIFNAYIGDIDVLEDEEFISVIGNDFDLEFSKYEGALVGWNYKGKDMISAPLKMNFWRAKTDNDRPGWLPFELRDTFKLDIMQQRVKSLEASFEGDFIKVVAKTKIASRRHAVLQYRLYYRPLYSFP